MMRIMLATVIAGLVVFAGSKLMAAAERNEGVLRERFKERLAEIDRLKDDGKIGETFEGFVSPVKSGEIGAKAQRLIDDENADRRELYKIIAEKQNTTPALVGENNFYRNYKKAPKGQWFRLKNGEWRQKEKE